MPCKNYLQHPKKNYLTAIQSAMRLTFRCTERGKFNHPCKKAQKSAKSAKKPKRRYSGTDELDH